MKIKKKYLEKFVEITPIDYKNSKIGIRKFLKYFPVTNLKEF